MDFLIIIISTLLFSAFFSGMEIAFVSANRLKIELDKKQSIFPSQIISIFTNNPKKYISTLLIGYTFALVIFTFSMAKYLDPQIVKYTSSEALKMTIKILISTFIILISAEYLPKILFRINPNAVLKFTAIPLIIIYIVFYPFTSFIVWFSESILKLFFKTDFSKKNDEFTFGKVDLDNLVNESNENSNGNEEVEHDLKIFQNALDFSKVKLRDCIIPRTEIEALSIDEDIETLKQKFIETGFSKLLIYKESIDNIIGYVHSSELFKNPKTIKSMLLSILIVPETMPANKLLSSFIKEQKSIAVVVDEFGGTAGIVTIEDIMEEIFGEIDDEFDLQGLTEEQISEKEFIFSGRLEIDYLNEKYNLNIPESEQYGTIAGFILYNYENVPNINDNIVIGDYNFKILKASTTKIELIKLFL